MYLKCSTRRKTARNTAVGPSSKTGACRNRIEAHIFVAFLAYCLHITLGRRLHALAPGLTPRAVLEKFASIMLLDVQLPTPDDRTLLLTRYTQPDQETQILLKKLKLELPPQPP